MRHRQLEAFGSCRLCLVEIEGRAGTPASCTTPVAQGMKVRTQTEQLAQLRRGVMELYISDHPLDCLTCAANGDCELQDMAGAVGLREVRYGYDGRQPSRAPRKDESNPYFTFDPSQMHRLFALRARLRGSAGHLRADHRGPRLRLAACRRRGCESFLDSECVSCGACVQACPTATLIEKIRRSRWASRSIPWSPPAPIAASAARFKAEMRGERVVRMVPYKDGKANHGHSCVKGRFAWGYATHRTASSSR